MYYKQGEKQLRFVPQEILQQITQQTARVRVKDKKFQPFHQFARFIEFLSVGPQ